MDRHFDTVEVGVTLYRVLLRRDPDAEGLANLQAALNAGEPLETVMRAMVRSEEFRTGLAPFLREALAEPG